MKEYLLTFIGAVLVCSVMSTLSGNDANSRYVRLAASLCVLLSAILPLVSFVSSLDGHKQGIMDKIIVGEDSYAAYEQIYKDELSSASSASVAQGLKAMLIRDLSLKSDELEVYVKLCEEDGEYRASEVNIVLCGSAMLKDPREIGDYIFRLLGCRCEIIYS